VRVVLVVPGGVDPPGSDRVIPFIHDLVKRLGSDHHVDIIAIGHEPEPREWRLFDSRVENVPIGRHSKADVARAIHRSSRVVSSGPRPDVIHGLWAGVTGLAAATIGRRYSIPSVVSMCGGELAAHPQISYGGGLTRGGRVLARTALALPTLTTAATEWMVAHAAEAGAHIDELVPLGADRSRFCPPATDVDGAHIVQVASLNCVKDQTLALRAFALVREARPDATFTLAGVDTMNGAHIALAEQLGIRDAVRFAGFVQPDALADLYRSATIHLNTSWHDAGPLAVLEAALCGLATVGTRVGHVADFAALPEPAAVAVGHDVRDVATGIERLLDDPSLRRSIAQRANAWATAHDADHTAAAFSAIYRRLTARSSRAAAATSGDEPRRKT
jgi:glycosyltransferase involved in cell wall biosynthesis